MCCKVKIYIFIFIYLYIYIFFWGIMFDKAYSLHVLSKTIVKF